MGSRFLLQVATALVLLAGSGTPAAAFVKEDLFVSMDDGIPIAATLYEPSAPTPDGGWPSIMLFHGFGGSRTLPESTGTSANGVAERWFADNGYVVLTFDARAHGASGGLFSLDGPREIDDVRALFQWLTSRPEIDPTRVGALGVSYGGGAVLRAAVEGLPFRTIVTGSTWTDLGAALFPQGLTKAGAIGALVNRLPPERISPAILDVQDDLLQSSNLGALRALARERSSRQFLDKLRIPVFMLQGRRDFAFDIGQAFAAYIRLQGRKRLYIGDVGHAPATNPPAEQQHYLTEIRLWFDRFLKGQRNGIDTRPPIELAPEPWTGRTFSYRRLPARKALRLSLRGRAILGPTGKAVRSIALPRRPIETLGAPVVGVTVSTTTSWHHLVAVVSALTPDGRELVVSQGGTLTPRLSRSPRILTIALIETATLIPARSRLRVTLAATSTAQNPLNVLYPVGVPADSRITIGAMRVTLPTLPKAISR